MKKNRILSALLAGALALTSAAPVSVPAAQTMGETAADAQTSAAGGEVTWVYSQDNNYWQEQPALTTTEWDESDHAELYIDVDENTTYQKLQDYLWGGCFNERGWERLSYLSEEDRDHVMDLLFDPDEPDGLHLTMARLPIGSSDYAIDLYSLDDAEDDYDLSEFSIDRDKQYLIPYIKEALERQPNIKFWASPWSPPYWMKQNADGTPRTQKDGGYIEFTEENMTAYGQYFRKFIEAYEAEGVHISMVSPQNEPTMYTGYSSCVWTGEQLRDFIKYYLGPELEGMGVQIYLGTFTNSRDSLMDPVLLDPDCRAYLSGVTFQWWSWMKARSLYRSGFDLGMMQSETMCGDGNNNWTYAENQFDLMWTYFECGITAYNLWNMVLEWDGENPGGVNTTGGWYQNAPITVDTEAGTYSLNPHYWECKHFMEYIKPGARRIETSGTFGAGYKAADAESDASYTAECRDIAFRNEDGTIALEVKNGSSSEKTVDINFNGRKVTATLPAHSINTFTAKGTPLTGGETDQTQTLAKEEIKTIVSVQSGQVMCINGDSVDDGRKIIQWPYGEEANQKWYFETVDGDPDCVKIKNLKNEKLIAVAGGSTASGAAGLLWSDEDGADQKWIIELEEETGYYKFRNVKSGLYLSVPDGNMTEAAQIVQLAESDSEGQLWSVTTVADKPYQSELDALDKAVDDAKALVEEQTQGEAVYTEETFAELTNALKAAKAVALNEDINEGRNNREQVTGAAAALQEAISGLNKIGEPDTDNKDDTEEKPGTPANTQTQQTSTETPKPSAADSTAQAAAEYEKQKAQAQEGTVALQEAEQAITSANTDKGDVAGSAFAVLRLKAAEANKAVKLSWSKVKDADGYIIYGAACGKKLVQVDEVNASKKSYTVKKLKKGTYYKYMVAAYKSIYGEKRVIETSATVHASPKGSKYGNPSAISYGKSKITVKKGKTFTLKPKYKSKTKVKTHIAKFRFESSDTKIASVDKKGKIKGKAKGSCYVYMYTQNGLYKRVKVTVK